MYHQFTGAEGIVRKALRRGEVLREVASSLRVPLDVVRAAHVFPIADMSQESRADEPMHSSDNDGTRIVYALRGPVAAASRL